eukprot:3854388-Rhodomonas_salina.1
MWARADPGEIKHKNFLKLSEPNSCQSRLRNVLRLRFLVFDFGVYGKGGCVSLIPRCVRTPTATRKSNTRSCIPGTSCTEDAISGI